VTEVERRLPHRWGVNGNDAGIGRRIIPDARSYVFFSAHHRTTGHDRLGISAASLLGRVAREGIARGGKESWAIDTAPAPNGPPFCRPMILSPFPSSPLPANARVRGVTNVTFMRDHKQPGQAETSRVFDTKRSIDTSRS